MVKKFSVDCDISGHKQKVSFFIGDPVAGANPIAFQSNWLAKNRRGAVPGSVSAILNRVSQISNYNKVSLEDLYSYMSYEMESQKRFVDDFNLASEFTKGQALEDDNNPFGGFKYSRGSKMQKGNATLEQGANAIRQEQILREKYASQQVENAGTDPGEKSFKPQNPTMIEENGFIKPKRKKGEAPISDEGMQSPLKHKRHSEKLNPADFNRKELAKNQAKAQEQKQAQQANRSLNSSAVNNSANMSQQRVNPNLAAIQQNQIQQNINKPTQSQQPQIQKPQNQQPQNQAPKIQSPNNLNNSINQNPNSQQNPQLRTNNNQQINQQINKPVNAKISSPQVKQEMVNQQDNSRKT